MPKNENETVMKASDATQAKPEASGSSVESDGRIERLVHETRQLGDDLMEWVNLKLRLVQIDFQERVDEELDFVFSGVIVLGMVLIALLLASFGIAFILGDLLGKLWYGFAIMAIVYLVVAAILSRVRPHLASGFRSNWRDDRVVTKTDTVEDDQ